MRPIKEKLYAEKIPMMRIKRDAGTMALFASPKAAIPIYCGLKKRESSQHYIFVMKENINRA
jgi:hypothetical protein